MKNERKRARETEQKTNKIISQDALTRTLSRYFDEKTVMDVIMFIHFSAIDRAMLKSYVLHWNIGFWREKVLMPVNSNGKCQ